MNTIQALIDRYRAAIAAADRHTCEVLEPALAAWRGAIAVVPHHTTKASFASFDGGETRLSTNDPASVDMAKRVRATLGERHVDDADFHATIDEILCMDAAREAEIARLKEAHDIPAIERVEADLYREIDVAASAVVSLPSQSLADVIAKTEFIEEVDGWDDDAFREVLMHDLRMLAKGRAH